MFQKPKMSKAGLLSVTRLFMLPIAVAALTAPAGALTVTDIGFRGNVAPAELEVKADGPVKIQRETRLEDKQVILYIPGATLGKGLGRPIDTSSFPGQVALISPYQVGGDDPSVRIVVQLRGTPDLEFAQTESGGILKIGSEKANPDQAEVTTHGKGTAQATDSTSDSESSQPNDEIAQVLRASKNKRFTGKPITLQVSEVDAQEIFSLIAETSGFNIVVSENVKGKLSLSLVDVPWDQALTVVLETLHLGAERHGNVLQVDTLDSITKAKQEEFAAKNADEAIAPRVTRVFPISYAALDKLKAIITDLAKAEQASLQAAAGPGGRTVGPVLQPPLTVVADDRTNSLIVRGLPEYVDRAKKIIEILDTQTPQVLIEGRVIEASETFTKSLQGQLAGIETEAGHGYGFAFNQLSPYDVLFGAGGTTTTNPFNLSSAGQSPGGTFGYQRLIGGNRINATLSLAESENQIKVISSPRTVVLNKQSATVTEILPVVITTQSVSNGVVTSTPTQLNGQISLVVTPTVTSDGSVHLQLTLERDITNQISASIGTVAQRTINTNVLVESGSTLVMGGFYNTDANFTTGGFPVLKDLPIIGALFRSDSDEKDRSEIMFFITPQIINPKKSGFAGGAST